MAKKHKHTDTDPHSSGGVPASEAVDENQDGVDDESGQHIEPPTAVTSPPPPSAPAHENEHIVGADPNVPLGDNHNSPSPFLDRDGNPLPTSSPSAEDHARNASAPHGSTAMPQGAGDYHPNPDMANATSAEHQPQNSAPYLDEDTHDFGPGGGEDKCRICGKTRAELGTKIGKPLTQAELEHPAVKDTNLLPPRLR